MEHNLILGISNLAFIPAILYATKRVHIMLLLVAMVGSTLMHISDDKYGLPGIYPLNRYSWAFLQLDRLAVVSLLMLPILEPAIRMYLFSPYFIFSVVAMLGSEYVRQFSSIPEKAIVHTFLHCIWHLGAAYTCFRFCYDTS